MASACVNHIHPTPPSYSSSNYTNWLNNPTISISKTHEHHHQQQQPKISPSSDMILPDDDDDVDDESSSNHNNNASSSPDFNFQLGNTTVAMLPADELFSDGKLLPLHFPTPKPPPVSSHFTDANNKATVAPQKELQILQENPHLFSPKAPRCSTRLKELLGFKKSSSTTTTTTTTQSKSIRQLYKNTTSTKTTLSSSSSSSSNTDASLTSPLLKHSSSSSSSDYHDDHPRRSLDSEKTIKPTPIGPKLRPIRPKPTPPPLQTPMMESPRMNPSGRVVFEGLERSTSCPSSFNNGGSKHNKQQQYYRGSLIERSYSANVHVNVNSNVRITPVLNVPVCSIRGSSKLMGFGQLFSSSSSSLKKESVNNGSHCKTHIHGVSKNNKKEKPKEIS